MKASIRELRCRLLWLYSLVMLCLIGIASTKTAYAAGVVSSPDQASLLSALEGGGTVVFDCEGTIYLTNTITISRDTVLDGDGSIAISGSNLVRVFHVGTNVQVTFSGLRIIEGASTNGAGLLNDGGIVTVSNCFFGGNKAIGADGINAVGNGVAPTPGQPGEGGAIYSTGDLKVFDSTFQSNLAKGGKGASGYSMDFAPRDGGPGQGGSILNRGVALLSGTVFRANSAVGGPNVVFDISNSIYGYPTAGSGFGGAVLNTGTLKMINCGFENNSGTVGQNVNYPKPGVGSSAGGAIYNAGGTLEQVDCRLAGNWAEEGGGLYNAENGSVGCVGTTYQSNFAGGGGALFNSNGRIEMSQSIVASNSIAGVSANPSGGSGQTGRGGGIWNSDKLVIADSQIVGNVARGGNGAGSFTMALYPGGRGEAGGLCNYGEATLTNCFLLDNVAKGGLGAVYPYIKGPEGSAAGAAIVNYGSLLLDGGIVSNNTVAVAVAEGGAAGIYTTDSIQLNGTLFSSNMLTLQASIPLGYGGMPYVSAAVFGVLGEGVADTGYEWFLNNVLLNGIVERSWTNSNFGMEDYGTYSVRFEDNVGRERTLSISQPVQLTVVPQDKIAEPGESVTFTVSATGSSPFYYQWFFGPSPIPQATNASLIVVAATTNIGVYSVVVSNAAGPANASANLFMRPVIEQHPQPLTLVSNANATFEVRAAGSGPLSYQWYKGEQAVLGGTSAILGISGIQASDAGSYSVIVSNAFGQVSSASALLNVIAPPEIIGGLTNHIVPYGQTVRFQVAASGLALSYQWLFNSSSIPGATRSSHAFLAQANKVGTYSVVVSNAAGTASASAQFDMPPAILAQPTSTVIGEGSNTVFTVVAEGSPALRYQWRFDGDDIPGATDSNYSIASVFEVHAGDYSVAVSNDFGGVVSSDAALSLGVLPIITVQPESKIAAVGSNVLFSVVAEGTVLLRYQWQLNGSNIAGATDSVYSIPSVSAYDAGVYSVTVSNDVGSVVSSSAQLILLGALHWQNTGGSSSRWLLENTNFFNSQPLVLPKMAASWRRIDVADFDGDGRSDFLWRNTNGALAVWIKNGGQRISSVSLKKGNPIAKGWSFVGTADFNHDGHLDLLWQNTKRQMMVSYLQGTKPLGSAMLREGKAPALGWKAVAAHDFDHDGDGDVLLQHDDGRLSIWKMEGLGFVAVSLVRDTSAGPAWRAAETADFNRDGDTDILLRHADGRLKVWLLHGTHFVGVASIKTGPAVATGWRVVGAE